MGSHDDSASRDDSASQDNKASQDNEAGQDDARWMRLAIELAWRCPPSTTAYSVGALLVAADGAELARGFSRQGGDPHVHAEEAALGTLSIPRDPLLAGATLYSTLEPCSRRKSRPRSCTELILASRYRWDDSQGAGICPGGSTGIRRVVIAWREPGLFVADAQGAELLVRGGVEVTELPELAGLAKAPNQHLGV